MTVVERSLFLDESKQTYHDQCNFVHLDCHDGVCSDHVHYGD